MDDETEKTVRRETNIQHQQPCSSSQGDEEPKTKIPRTTELPRSRMHNMRIPIIRPKMPSGPTGAAVRLITDPPPIEASSSNPRPLISLLDRTEFRDRNKVILAPQTSKPKKPYYTELNEIRKEFGIPETFDTTKPNTMSGVALADKLQLLQRLRGENKFLRESIQKKNEVCQTRTQTIEQLQRSTSEVLNHCQVLRDTLNEVESETDRIRNQMR